MNRLIDSSVLVIAFTIILGSVVSGCENDISEVNRVTSYEKLPLQTIINSRITYTDSTIVEFIVDAGQIDRYRDEEGPRDEFSNNVEVVTYSKSGSFESQINSQSATNYVDQKIMIARNNVILKNYEGKMLETELLTWDDEADRIYTDKFVKITTPTEILLGQGLEAKPDFSRYEIQNITGTIKVDSEENDSISETQ